MNVGDVTRESEIEHLIHESGFTELSLAIDRIGCAFIFTKGSS